jgi:hypothetical protein
VKDQKALFDRLRVSAALATAFLAVS